ncbi:dTDP-4-dehydrorhamnose 3,5-epimerase family protein [Parvibaculum sp.]|jgi:dTDP-4-dehydrorhamnose 3,5-epimerase
MSDLRLPEGVNLTPLASHFDSRGDLTEIFRQSWTGDFHPLQWNLVRSEANTLRGFHVHPRHYDYLVMIDGAMQLALKDLRPGSPTENLATTLILDATVPASIAIPPGVGHGFYFPDKAMHIYSVSEYWSREEEIGCRWDDPELGIAWGAPDATLSPRDATAGAYREMVADYVARTECLLPEEAGIIRA